jgi:hypothetical protein
MALGTRTITPAFERQAGDTTPIKVKLTPVALVGADGEVLPKKTYEFSVAANGTINGTVATTFDLPVPSTGFITWKIDLTHGGNDVGTARFSLGAGAATTLAAVIAGGVSLTPTVQAFVEEQIAGVEMGEVEWTDVLNKPDVVISDAGSPIILSGVWGGSQAQYEEIETPAAATVYLVTE